TKQNTTLTQAAWARRFPASRISKQDAIAWMARTIRKNPGQITLIAIGPLSNVGALIERDPAAFHMLKRVVLMGGSIRRDYHDLENVPSRGPAREYNIVTDVPSAQKLFTSGVPITMLPLDSTLLLRMDDGQQQIVFKRNTPLTDALAHLTSQWGAKRTSRIPTLFDVMAVEEAIDGKLCPLQPMHIRVDDGGYTRVETGAPNAFVCLNSDPNTFFQFLIPRLTQQSLRPANGETCSSNSSGE
ncbi:MAG TPA: nucleoside hydrolase, partial [Acidobacteriaceae bacterium]|nr:nucleoside hydrolase [Acidobacteriaceae bacterium]